MRRAGQPHCGQESNRFKPRATWLAAALLMQLATPHALAQSTAATDEKSAEKSKSKDEATNQLDRVVVTGSTGLARTVRESSVAVTVADREALDRKAPYSAAEAMELVPGMYIEASAGEMSNNYSVRGMSGGNQRWVQVQEDGLPIFYYPSWSADGLVKSELGIDRMEAVRGGTSAILTANGAGATINFLTFRNQGKPEGALRLTTSDYNQKRVDLRYAGGLGDGWFGGVSGYYRVDDGVRYPEFTGNKGGTVRAHIGRKIEGGEWSVNLKGMHDHTMFYLPIPVIGKDNPRSLPGMDARYGTMIGLDSGVQTVRTSLVPGSFMQTVDSRDGYDHKAFALGYNYEKALSPAWKLSSKGRYTDSDVTASVVFSSSNNSLRPAVDRLDPAKFGYVKEMLDRFGPACGGTCKPAVRIVSTGEILSTPEQLNALNGNGLLSDNVLQADKQVNREFVNDMRLTWNTERNSLGLGLLTFNSLSEGGSPVSARFVTDVRNHARRVDLVALDPAGKVVGSYTENGVREHSTWGDGNDRSHNKSMSVYLNDEYKVNDALRIDAGLRIERFRYLQGRGGFGEYEPIPGAFKPGCDRSALGDAACDVDNIIANNYWAYPTNGQYEMVRNRWTEPSWTIGGNYLLNNNIALYGRFAKSYQTTGDLPVTKIQFGELGARVQAKNIAATLTFYKANFKGDPNSAEVDNAQIEMLQGVKSQGLEFEVSWRPLRWFEFAATGVVQRSRFSVNNLRVLRGTGTDLEALLKEATSWSGNRPERTPDRNFTLAPSVFFNDGKGEFTVAWHYVGDRFADVSNSVRLPAYKTINLSLRYELTPSLTLNAAVRNLTNTIGLTEGNPRSGFVQAPAGSDYYYARPILGRNAQLSVTMNF
ncbi:TonB-dependent siderophore receptor [Roseateles toxinivorans]|uniref:TonB-dependent receptor-like protein n=1 Tax=Roseateles toxinivorans TaxID=270368 RepID=A0A4R6QLV0_9BURK|nr:TonB-dependent receptor [Roseateles toxinivorans]TDP64149.1 TonB-dependent receptor-like protein [Roseateles toxinivorans]